MPSCGTKKMAGGGAVSKNKRSYDGGIYTAEMGPPPFDIDMGSSPKPTKKEMMPPKPAPKQKLKEAPRDLMPEDFARMKREEEAKKKKKMAAGGAVKKEDKQNQNDLLKEREQLVSQREKLLRPGRNIFEIAASRGVARPLRAGSTEDKTRVMDDRYVKPGQGDKDAAAAWDSRMNYLDSRIEDIDSQLKKRSNKFAMGGAVQQAKVGKVMKEFKAGSLHSGPGGKVVKSPKQAIAIALSEARRMKKK